MHLNRARSKILSEKNRNVIAVGNKIPKMLDDESIVWMTLEEIANNLKRDSIVIWILDIMIRFHIHGTNKKRQ